MHGVVGGIAAAVGSVAAEVDPTKQPVRASAYVSLFLTAALVLLLLSFLRHLRRANQNLGSARLPAPGAADREATDGEVPPPDAPATGRSGADGR
ncbi:MAG: hypothetical protein MUF35_04805 [Candidatus Nanopelagicales bacterium]|jgi:hypothetical protein|nr:hypothetical protein [Candidatus Nanopelagicales bacterium]